MTSPYMNSPSIHRNFQVSTGTSPGEDRIPNEIYKYIFRTNQNDHTEKNSANDSTSQWSNGLTQAHDANGIYAGCTLLKKYNAI